MNKMYNFSLTYDEAMLLDGKVSEKSQGIVDVAKKEHEFGLDDFCNEILRKAMEKGKLSWGRKKISSCEHCDDKPSGYHTYTRNSRYHRKGAPNYDAPYEYSGIDPFQGFVVFQGLSGVCVDCWYKKYLPVLVNYIIENDLPIEIQKNDIAESLYKKDDIRICFKCGEEIRESEMGTSMTMMGDGRYPSTCPKCGATSTIFGPSHKTTDKYVMVKTQT